jgi:hypothetical protein
MLHQLSPRSVCHQRRLTPSPPIVS